MARALAQTGKFQVAGLCGVTRYALKDRQKSDITRWNDVTIERMACTDYGTRSIPGRLCDYATFFLQALRRLLFGPRPDVVIAMTSPPLIVIAGVITKIFRGSRLIYWVQDLYPEIIATTPAKRKRLICRILSAVADWVDARTDLHVVPGACMEQTLRQRKYGGKINVSVIPNWSVIPTGSEAAGSSGEFRRANHLTEKFVVMYSGNLGRAHDWETIAEGFSLAAANCPRLALVLIGQGYGMERLRKWHSSRQNLPIHFLPHQPRQNLGAALGAADLHIVSQSPDFDGLVVPSKFHGIASVGRPVHFIGSDRNTVSRTILDHGLGSVSAAGEPAQFARALERFIHDPSFTGQCAMAVTRWQEECGATEKALAQWIKAVEQIARIQESSNQ
nr:glycosyltransferase family 4 protein [Oscillatoria laete-virens]